MIGKVALVTGAGSGIGQATAFSLAASGASLVLAGRRSKPLEETAKRAVALGAAAALSVQADMAIESDADRVVNVALSEFGRLDLAVNSAGGGSGIMPLQEFDEKTFDDLLDLNVKSAWLSLKYEIPAMIASGSGSIVNVSSLQGLRGVRNGSIYSAAKHAVVGLTKSAALEVASAGVRVNVVCPGPVRTGLFSAILQERMPEIPAEEAELRFASTYPLQRIAEPEEVAQTILWLLGPGAAYITGAVVPVDGGASA